MSKTIVIGASHAGAACIKTMLTSYDTENEAVVLGQNSNASFLGCGMALRIGGQVAGPKGLFYPDKDELEQLGAKIYMSSPMRSIDYDKRGTIAFVDEQKHFETYDKSTFATGSQPIIPLIKGVSMKEDSLELEPKLENAQFIKLHQNAEDVIERLKEKAISHVAVVGADYIGVELAETFQRKGKEVTFIDVVETCLAGYYDRDLSDVMTDNLQEHGIHLTSGEAVQGIVGKTRVEKITTDKSGCDVNMVTLAVGFHPNIALAQDKIRLFPSGAFLADRYQETSMPDVYAIGDCTTIYNDAIQSADYIAFASNAIRTEVVAAHNAYSHKLEGAGTQGSSGISVYGLNMVSIGLTLEKAKARGSDALGVEYVGSQELEFI